VAGAAPGDSAAPVGHRRAGLVPRGDRLGPGTGRKGSDLTGPSPVDRGKPGSKIHVISDRTGLQLHLAVSAANTPDAQLLLPMLDTMPALAGRRGRPRRRPDKLHADKA
jgi:hypothetical protein